jgi:hypothetical protein
VQIETWELSLVKLEAEEDPELDISEADIHLAADTLRDVVLKCEDPVTMRTFFSSFVRNIVMESDRLVVDYDPTKLMNQQATVVHSKNRWLPEQVLLRTKRSVKLVLILPPRLAARQAA